MTLRIACVQLTPDGDRNAGQITAVAGVRRAALGGARLVALPEYATQLHSSGRVMRAGASDEEYDEALAALRNAARECNVWILVGSLTIRGGDDKILNRSYLITDQGLIAATYDKLHMFDATLPGGRNIRESSMYEAGSRAVLVESEWGRLGMTICYDLRFPHLFRALAKENARIIFVPSAFTRATGQMHWHALLRARAIENACFIVAPATCGTSPESHPTFGHSMVIDPFGAILVEAGDIPGEFFADLELEQVELARSRIPSLNHDREFTLDVVRSE